MTKPDLTRSGYDNYEGFWGNPFYEDNLKGLTEHQFTQQIFKPSPARIYHDAKRNCTVTEPYTGENLDGLDGRIDPVGWDHEHCLVCYFAIREGHTYWRNNEGGLLCDACHEHYYGTADT